jgi:GTP-sensing pleiotropic transcriptional regulator CodY
MAIPGHNLDVAWQGHLDRVAAGTRLGAEPLTQQEGTVSATYENRVLPSRLSTMMGISLQRHVQDEFDVDTLEQMALRLAISEVCR